MMIRNMGQTNPKLESNNRNMNQLTSHEHGIILISSKQLGYGWAVREVDRGLEWLQDRRSMSEFTASTWSGGNLFPLIIHTLVEFWESAHSLEGPRVFPRGRD